MNTNAWYTVENIVCCYESFSLELKNEFVSAVVNEPSVF